VIAGFFAIEGDGVLVAGYGRAIESFLRLAPCRTFGAQIDQHEMSVRASRHDVEPKRLQGLRQRLRIFHNGPRVELEIRLQRFAERYSLGRDSHA